MKDLDKLSEQMLLSVFISNPVNMDETILPLANDFSVDGNRFIFESIIELTADSHPVDVMTLAHHLERTGKLTSAGGLAYLMEVADRAGTLLNINAYSSQVRGRALERKLASAGDFINKLALSRTGNPEEKLQESEALLYKIIDEGQTSKNIRHVNPILSDAIQTITDRFESDGTMTGIPTCFKDLDEATGGLQRGDLIIIAGRPSMGKELTLDSKVLLSCGEFKRMGDIKMNDKVASIDGENSIVTGVFPQGNKPVYKLIFADGRTVDAGLDHQWEIMCRDWDSPRVVTTSWLIEKLKYKRYQNKLCIPYLSGDFGIDKDLLVHPYLLGVLLGDGCFTGGSIQLSTSFEYIKNKIEPHLMGANFSSNRGIYYQLTTKKGTENKLLDAIKNLGLIDKYSDEKFIPSQYLYASKESRLELLRGLIDIDGTVEKCGAMTYTTTSERMSKEIQSLARSLGSFASISSRMTKYPYAGVICKKKKSYTIYISNNDCAKFVTIPHKLKTVKEKNRERKLSISSIEYIGERECQCISVSHKRELYLTNDYIVTHNTSIAMNIAENASGKGFKGAIISLEMPAAQLVIRMISSVGKIDSVKLRKGDLREDDFDKIGAAVSQIRDMPLYIDDSSTYSVMDIRSSARKIKRHLEGLDYIVIDYLQLMTSHSKGRNRNEEISEISRSLKGMAKEMGIAVIALSQLNRDLEKRPDKRPMMSDLRESGAIEQDADLILFVYRDEVYNPDTADAGRAEIIIGKQRNGDLGTIILDFVKNCSKFENPSMTRGDY